MIFNRLYGKVGDQLGFSSFFLLSEKKKKSISPVLEGFLHGSAGKESTCNQEHRRQLYPWVREVPGGGKGNSLPHSCLENPIDRGAWGYSSKGCKDGVKLSPLLLCFWLPESSSVNYGIYPDADRKTVYC